MLRTWISDSSWGSHDSLPHGTVAHCQVALAIQNQILGVWARFSIAGKHYQFCSFPAHQQDPVKRSSCQLIQVTVNKPKNPAKSPPGHHFWFTTISQPKQSTSRSDVFWLSINNDRHCQCKLKIVMHHICCWWDHPFVASIWLHCFCSAKMKLFFFPQKHLQLIHCRKHTNVCVSISNNSMWIRCFLRPAVKQLKSANHPTSSLANESKRGVC